MWGILRFLGSLSVAILVTAAGLIWNANELVTFGLGLGALTATAWLVLKLHPAFGRAGTLSKIETKRSLIEEARGLAAAYTQSPNQQTFRHRLEGSLLYPKLRPYLSADYLKKLNAARTVYAVADGARYDPLVEWFLDDIDRLEAEWKVRPTD